MPLKTCFKLMILIIAKKKKQTNIPLVYKSATTCRGGYLKKIFFGKSSK